MPNFKPYPKIHRLGKDETMSLSGSILDGTVYIQEKLDGANASIWMDDEGNIRCGSRTQDVTEKPFNGFPEYVMAHEGINRYLKDNPKDRLYGEWLVRHTVGYNETSYRKFYLFDIEVTPLNMNMDIEFMYDVAKDYGIETAYFVGKFENPTPEQVQEYCGKSQYGQKWEGVVIKNPSFRNKFGDPCHAKIVTQEFKEDNGVTFGGNSKDSNTYEEMYMVNKYMTLERVRKIVQKIEAIDGKAKLSDIPKVQSMAYHDMLTEEIWEISQKKMVIDFAKLQTLCYKKAIFIFKNILEDDISVAFSNLR